MHIQSLATRGRAHIAFALAVGIGLAACGDSSTSTKPPLFDSRIIAFVSDSANYDSVSRFSGTSIFVMHADGSHKTPLTSVHHRDGAPRWSPDGSSIAFETDRSPAGIWIMNADGSNQRPLLSVPEFDALDLHWSPDGKSIAFAAFSTNGPSGVIMIADANGAHAHRLTTNPPVERWPSWSPDGTRLAFMASVDSVGYSIFVVNRDGTGQHRITFGPDLQPEWSPDGTHILFTTFEDLQHSRLAEVRTDGSDRRTLSSGADDFDPAWSPDGRKIAYDAPATDAASPGPTEIYLINANGTDVRQITTFGSVAGAFSISRAPAWKPTP